MEKKTLIFLKVDLTKVHNITIAKLLEILERANINLTLLVRLLRSHKVTQYLKLKQKIKSQIGSRKQ